jgi:hypothetical protein
VCALLPKRSLALRHLTRGTHQGPTPSNFVERHLTRLCLAQMVSLKVGFARREDIAISMKSRGVALGQTPRDSGVRPHSSQESRHPLLVRDFCTEEGPNRPSPCAVAHGRKRARQRAITTVPHNSDTNECDMPRRDRRCGPICRHRCLLRKANKGRSYVREEKEVG